MLEKQADRYLMKVTMEKCKFLHWGRDNSMYQYMLGAIQLKSSSVEMNLGILVDVKQHVSQKCVPAT